MIGPDPSPAQGGAHALLAELLGTALSCKHTQAQKTVHARGIPLPTPQRPGPIQSSTSGELQTIQHPWSKYRSST